MSERALGPQFREQLMQEAGRHHAARVLGVKPADVEMTAFTNWQPEEPGKLSNQPSPFVRPGSTHIGHYTHRSGEGRWDVSMALYPEEKASQHIFSSFEHPGLRAPLVEFSDEAWSHYQEHEAQRGRAVRPYPGNRVPLPRDVQ